jgi:autotransporter-associated beta strand protein
MNRSMFGLTSCIALVATLAFAAEVSAVTLAWDTQTLTAGAQGGTGNWHGSLQGRNFWWNGTTNVAWSDGSIASFGPNAGTVTVDSAVSASGLVFSTNGYSVGGSSVLTLSGGNIVQVTNASDTATISAPIGGSSGLEKDGDGTLTLATTSALSGSATINAGTLQLNSSGVLSSAGNIQVAAAAGQSGTLALDGASARITQAGSSTLEVGNGTSGTAVLNLSPTSSGATFDTGTGQMTISKTGTVNIGNPAGGSFGTTFNANGNVTIDGGVLTRNGGSAFNLAAGKTMTVQNGGRASFTYTNDYTTANATYNITGSGSKIEASSDLSIGAGSQVNVSSGGAFVSGNFMDVHANATLTVDGASSSVTEKNQSVWGIGAPANVTFSNGATGDLEGEVDLAPGAVSGSSATLNVQSGATVGVGTLALVADDSSGLSATININGAGSSLNQNIPGLISSTITVGNSVSSPAAINIGTTAGGGSLTTGTGLVTINRTGSVTVGNGANAGTLNVSGPIIVNAGGSLTINSGSVATISGAYFGTAIGGGGGQVNFGSSINPGYGVGNAANATFGGNVALASTAGLNIEIGGTTSGTQFDHVNVTGQLALSGTLTVSLINGFTPVAGNSFHILDWGSRNGTFATLSLASLPSSLMWNTLPLYSAGTLAVNLAGDFNGDNKVDAADYVALRKAGGSQTDYNIWRANFGNNARGQGVDVSHFQGSTGISQNSWNQMAAEGKTFAFIKATEGLTGPDDAAMSNNVARATSAGILNGVYHYAHPENRPTPAGAVMEADHLLNYAGTAIGQGHLRPVLDIEGSSSNLSASALTDWVIAFINEVVAMRGSSAAPIIYTTPFFTNSKFDARIANYDLWIEDQSNLNDPQTGRPNASDLGQFANWSFWQYNVDTAGGISPIDLNVVHGEYKPLSSFVIPPVTSASASVPEPGYAALFLIAMISFVSFRRI